MALATAHSLTYRYPGAKDAVLDAVDFEIEPGLTLVTGGSGSGKSTLLRLLNGLVPHFHGGRIEGAMRVADRDVLRTRTRDLARITGFVFQDPEHQFVYQVVEDEVAFGLENLACPRHAIRERVEVALQAVSIEHLRDRRLSTLSGGEQQRVALASALAVRPQLIALDEPTSQLDDDGGAALVDACEQLAADGCSFVVAEHRLERFARLVRRTLRVTNGKVVDGDPFRAAVPKPRAALAKPGSAGAARTVCALSDADVRLGGVEVLCSVSLEVAAGEAIAVIGRNGGGKTTLLRTLAGAVEPSRGRVWREGGRVAYLPQNPGMLLHRASVRDEVALTLKRTGSKDEPDRVLADFALLHLADRDPRDLSSGERQRVAIAAVLAGGPSLALLDEPTRGMDDEARQRMSALVARLTEQGTAVVIATHDRELAALAAHRVVNVGAGALVEAA